MKKTINISIFILLCLLQRFTANAQWVQTNGPYGAFVTSLAVSGANVFAGTNEAGVYLSTNNGTSWTVVNNGLTSKSVTSIAVIGTNIFAGTSNGVFLTNNNGASWVLVNSGMSGNSVKNLAVIGTTLFAGTDDGVFRSTNNGSSWTSANSGLPGSFFLNIISLAVSGTTLFSSTEDGIFRSTNNGNSWTAVNSGIPSSPFGYNYILAVHGTTIYAAGDDGVFRSTNNGTSWTAVTNALANASYLTFTVNGANILAGTNIGMFLSTNNGSSWSAVNSGLTNPSITTLAVVGTTVIAGTSSEIFVSSNNGSSWTSSNSGIVGTSIKALAVIGTTIFAGTSTSVFLSNNDGNSWVSVSNGLANKEIKTLVASGTTLFAGTDDGIFRSTNNGSSWAAVNTGLTATYITAMAVSGTTLFAGTYEGVFRSTNNGTSWTAVNSGLPSSFFLEIISLAANGTTLFASTEDGIFRSTNNGTSWTAANSGIPSSPFGYYYVLAVHGTTIYATGDDGVFRSTNNGTSWTAVTNALANVEYLTFATGSTKIFAGTDSGVFVSTDNGNSWTPNNNGLINDYVYSLAIIGTNIFAGTQGGGVYFTQTETPTSLEVSPATINQTAATGSANISVTSNCSAWTVSGAPAWATVTPTSGSNNGTITVNIQANTSTQPRSATITIEGCSISRTVTITQAGAAVTLEVSPATINQPAAAGSANISVTSNCSAWTVSGAPTWATVTPTSGSNNGMINVSFMANTSTQSRSATLTIAGCNISRMVNITQAGATSTIPWTRSITGSNHIIIAQAVLTATLDGTPLEPGDAIGFFFERNDSLHCSNYLILTGQNASVAVYGNDASSPGKNGFAPGEIFNIKIYKASSQQVFDAQAVFAPAGTVIPPLTITHTDAYTTNGISLLTHVTANTCPAPTTSEFSHSNLTTSSAQLSTTASGDQFQFRHKPSSGSIWTTTAESASTSANISSLTAGTSYDYQVRRRCTNNVWSDWSVSNTFTTTAATCSAPTTSEFSHSNVTTSSAQLSTTAAGDQFQFRYKPSSGSTWTTTAESASNSANISSLSASTSYDYQVRRRCTNNVWSDWSASNTFTTTAATCSAPTTSEFSHSNVTTSSAQLSTTAAGDQFQFRHKPSSGSTWTTTAESASNSANISSLSASTSYDYQVRRRCTNNVWSDWSASKLFTTTPLSTIPWVRSITGSNHIIIAQATLTATLDGIPLEPGDAIGFFFERNDSLHCSNYLILTGQNASVAVYGNDASSPGKNGFAPGEIFNIKIYKASSQQVFDAQAVFAPAGTVIPPLTITHTDAYTTNGISLLTHVTANTAMRPLAGFSADTLCGTAPLAIQFSDQSSNTPQMWHWDFGNGAVSLEQHPTAVFVEPGIYTVRLIAANAAGQDTLERVNYITVVGQVSATVLPGDTICAGVRLELLAEGAESFVWSGPNLDTETGAITGATPTEAGNYVYQVVGSTNNCAAPPAMVAVYVRPIPEVMLNVSADTICRQGILSMSASGAATYTWQGVGLSAVTGSMVTAMPDTSGLITYSVTGSANGCTAAPKKREVWVRPRPQIVASADRVSICLGDTVTLSAVGADAIFWNGSGLLSFSGAAVEASPQQTGTITYQVSGNTAGCAAQTASVTIDVNSNALSAVITVSDCPGPDLVFSAAVSNGGSLPNILWYRNEQPVWNGPEYTLFGAQNGDEVYCRATPVNGPPCTTPAVALSNVITVECIASAAQDLLPGMERLALSPNPNNGTFALDVALSAPLRGRLLVFDVLGRPVWQQAVQWPVGQHRFDVQISGLAPGAYRLVVEAEGRMYHQAFVVVR